MLCADRGWESPWLLQADQEATAEAAMWGWGGTGPANPVLLTLLRSGHVRRMLPLVSYVTAAESFPISPLFATNYSFN